MLIITSKSATRREAEKVYREHNITRRTVSPMGGGILESAPNSPSMQCQCGYCHTHRKGSAITGTAEPGKDR